jgi:hypothetical protein
MDKNNDKPNILMRIGVIVGIIIILFVVCVGIIKLVPKAFSSFGNVGASFSSLFNPKEKLTIKFTPDSITSGQQTSLSFTNNSKENGGFYTLSYECKNGIQLSYRNGQTNIPVNCNSAYPLSPTNNSLTLIGTSPAGVKDTVSVSLNYTKTGSSTPIVTGKANLTITNTGSVTVNPPVATSTPNPNNGGQTPRPTYPSQPAEYGKADLVVRLVDVTYTTQNSAVIKFAVTNAGTRRSGAWSFRTNQPMANPADNVKYSGTLVTLLPGYSTGTITLQLVGIKPEGGIVSILVNDNGSVDESRTDNNTLQVTIPASYNGGNGSLNPDLTVQIIETGTVGYNNQFIKTNNIRSSDKARIHFVVKNNGGQQTGGWTLTASLPNAASGNFTSQIQNSLAPGQTADFYIDFDGFQNQGSSITTITVDPDNRVYESNETNNTASTYLNITY